jgi:hypothetical protein
MPVRLAALYSHGLSDPFELARFSADARDTAELLGG